MPLAPLTVDSALPYLRGRGMVTAADIVDGDVEIVDVGRRNQNLKVKLRRGGYLMKQPGRGEPGTEATVAIESGFYHRVGHDPALAELARVVPRSHGFDEERGVLVLELVAGTALWEHYASSGGIAVETAAQLGRAIAIVHRVLRDGAAGEAEPEPPWVLGVHRPPAQALAYLSPAQLQVHRIAQRAGIGEQLDRLRSSWTGDTMIHDDLKGDNVLVVPGTPVTVQIVDWELYRRGDPAWDVASLLRDAVEYWLGSVPFTGQSTPEDWLARAGMQLGALHPAVRALWQAYREEAGIDRAAAAAMFERIVGYTAARMIQAAHELAVSGHEIPNRALALLQLAVNILGAPARAALHVFGVPPGWTRRNDAAPAA
ncbi:MAG TPA: phosphotransferase [Kofleriaceae bacterium]|nr:phosphotransferase [Kofleriaceae bacterium]